MKLNVKLLSLVAAVAALVTSCVNEGLQEPLDAEILDAVSTLEEQAAAVEASVNDLQNLQTSLKEYDVELDAEIVALLEQHVADFKKGGVSLEEGILAAFELQKKLGATVGSLVAELDSDIYTIKLKKNFTELETGVKAWVGENFESLYPVAVAEAMVKAYVAKFDSQLSKQKLYVDALVSDVEAGLRKDEEPEELKALALSVQETSCDSKKLGEELAALTAEVEKEYTTAVRTMLSESAQFDGEALKMFNANAGIQLASVDNSLSSLITRVELCESQLSGILARLGALEGLVEDLEELLGMIQSVTLMTEYSADEAVAYYNMGSSTTSEGYKVRQPSGNIDLKYLVRPAAAASSLTASSLWNNGLKVFGYYANRIQQSAVGNLQNFTIKNVTANSTTGVVTVTVNNSLSDDFYYKKTGAKMALSVTTGKTDITSKFVEVVPKDASGTVYLESLTLSKDEVEFDDGDELNLSAIISPSNVTNKALVWTTENKDVVTVDESGRITGTGVGSAIVTVTSRGTDEWGRTLSATCKVKVNPAIKLSGPSYVEEGKTADLTLDFPSSMLIESKVWYTSDENKVTVSDGVISGVANTYSEYTYEYSPVTVYCKINDNITLSHEVKVVVPQPRQVKFNNYADDAREITVKVGQSVSLAGTILPAEASSNFRLFYESNAGVLGWIDSKTGDINGNTSVGTVNVYARVFEIDRHRRFAPGKSLTREIVVKVEPYYVTSITLPSAFELEPGATGSISAALKSDVEGEAPTYTDLTWTSSNTDVLTIDPITGEYEAKAIGSALITATAPSKSTVPGEDPAYATVGVTVTKKENKPNVGDYYYADGTWSPDYNPTAGNPVIGVVFYAENPYLQDTKLPDYCINGLVISPVEYSNITFGQYYGDYYANRDYSIRNYVSNKGIEAYNKRNEVINGYALTWAYGEYRKDFASSDYVSAFDVSTGVAASHASNVLTPNGKASSWYIPSYCEWRLIYENINVLNQKLSIGTEIGSGYYLTTTMQIKGTYEDSYAYPFDMSTGKHIEVGNPKAVVVKARVVLAF